MKQLIFSLIIFINFSCTHAQEDKIDHAKIKEDLNEILTDLSRHYIYFHEKNIDLNCIRAHYENEIPKIKTEEQTVLFFEYLLDEFYDSHLILNTNRDSSFRLFAPIYATIKDGKSFISSVWQTQIENAIPNILGAEILKINGTDFDEAIEAFPTHCNDKNASEVREWIVNKILAGRYNQPRVLTLSLGNKETVEIDLDTFGFKPNPELLTSSREDEIGIIRINNSLGNNNLINDFDKALDNLMNTKGLIIDLRNTIDGGNTYVARGIMGRFIEEPKPYQKHWMSESYDENPMVHRSWVEYVSPRKEQYPKPLVILVGRWTGSMGEGLAIGFDGMERAEVVGSEMARLAGEMNGFSFIHQSFGYRLSTARLFHVDGTPREKYVPTHYVNQTTTEKDEILEKGMELINDKAE